MRYELWVVSYHDKKKKIATFDNTRYATLLISELQYDNVFRDYELLDTKTKQVVLTTNKKENTNE
jgi:hypothetical protein